MAIWKDIFDYDGLYRISDQGVIRSLKDGNKILLLTVNQSGYLRCNLYNKWHERRHHRVHRLVMETFVGPSDLQVNHINGIKTDNRLENLEYVTPSGNTLHAYRIGLAKPVNGERHGGSKLTEQDIQNIRLQYKSGKVQREIADEYQISQFHVSSIVRNKSWKHL